MKSAARIIGWICFGIASVLYLIATFYFGAGFASAIAAYKAGDAIGLGAVLLIFMTVGSIAYAAVSVVSLVGTIVANVKRGERKFFFAPVVTLALSVLTWIVFLWIGSSAA